MWFSSARNLLTTTARCTCPPPPPVRQKIPPSHARHGRRRGVLPRSVFLNRTLAASPRWQKQRSVFVLTPNEHGGCLSPLVRHPPLPGQPDTAIPPQQKPPTVCAFELTPKPFPRTTDECPPPLRPCLYSLRVPFSGHSQPPTTTSNPSLNRRSVRRGRESYRPRVRRRRGAAIPGISAVSSASSTTPRVEHQQTQILPRSARRTTIPERFCRTPRGRLDAAHTRFDSSRWRGSPSCLAPATRKNRGGRWTKFPILRVPPSGPPP